MDTLPIVIGVSVSLLVLGATLIVYNWMASRRVARIYRRLKGGTADASDGLPARGVAAWFESLGSQPADSGLGRALLDSEVPHLLSRAGWRGGKPRMIFVAVQLMLPLVGMLVALLLAPSKWLNPIGSPLVSTLLIVAIVGYLMPKMVLRRLAQKRAAQIATEVPTLVHLLRTLFDTGLGVEQTLIEVCEQNQRVLPALAKELCAVLRNIGAGADQDEALLEMAEGLQVQDLTDLVKLLRQVNRYGGSIKQPLTDFAEVLHDRRRTELQERVSKMSAKMTVVMVLCMFPALLIFIAGPGFFGLMAALSNR